MIIKNFKKLAKTTLREKALAIAEAGYKAINIAATVNNKFKIKNNKLEIIDSSGVLKVFDLAAFNKIFIIGIGKGSALASIAAAKILGERLTGGIALDVQPPRGIIRNSKQNSAENKLKIFQGTHPLPSKQNVKATEKIIELARNAGKDDLVIFFICGGGSALLCADDSELKHSQNVFKNLTKAGADILELNTVRKHLSEIKGGGLAKILYPASVLSLIVSDVLGNDISTVASGPTVYDKTTKNDAIKVLKKYNLQPLRQLADCNQQLKETPKSKKYFKNVKNVLFVCNQDAVLAMADKVRKLGFNEKIYSLALEGEAKDIFSPLIKKIKSKEALIAAGETTVKLTNDQPQAVEQSSLRGRRLTTYDKKSKGGRNQEAVLGAIEQFSKNLCVVSFASDGHDNSEAAGAIGDILVLQKAKKLKINPNEYLKKHNSFNFFKKTGDAIYSKKDCFNVADLMIVIRE